MPTIPQVFILALLSLLIVLAGVIVLSLHRLRTEIGAALRGIQLQLAFVAGRIGLKNRDLEAQVPLVKEPEGATDAENFSEWNEADWLIARAEEEAAPEEAAHER